MSAVNLQDAVDHMDSGDDQATAYINRRDGELVLVVEMDLTDFDPEENFADMAEWQQEVILRDRRVLADSDFVALPNQHDIHEYKIMERFCHSLCDERLQNVLLPTIAGRGAFRRFKDRVIVEGVREDWFAFRNAALKRIAADFLDSENIAYKDE